MTLVVGTRGTHPRQQTEKDLWSWMIVFEVKVSASVVPFEHSSISPVLLYYYQRPVR